MNFIKKFFRSELGKGSIILFILMNIFNFLNYIFHFSMARMLTPADYGILGVLMSLIYIYSIPSEAIQGVFTKYTSRFNAEKQEGKIKGMMVNGLKKSVFYGIIGFIVANIVGLFISKFLDINFWLIATINLSILGILFLSVLRGILQGKKKFSIYGWNLILEASIKLIIAISLVLFGFRVFGPAIGLVTGFIIGILFCIYSLRDTSSKEAKNVKLDGVGQYSRSFFGVMVAVVLMYSLDMILARRFFTEDIAGKYAVVSMLSKMILFGTQPISRALFPISAERFAKGDKTKELFYKSAITIALLCSAAIFVFLFFPRLLITLLFGLKYADVSGALIYVGLALTALSFTYLVIIYGLSIDRFKNYYYLFFFVILEIILLSIFNKTVIEFSLAFMVSNILMFLGSIILVKVRK